MRPHAKEFLSWLVPQPKVRLGFWTGASSDKERMGRRDSVLELKSKLKKKDIVCVLGPFNQFKRHCKDPGAMHPGTTKPVICKPIQFIKSIAPKYADIVLVDDSALKSGGVGPSGARRHANKPEEFIVMKTFAGDSSDNELEVGKGSGMLALQARLKELEAARKDRF